MKRIASLVLSGLIGISFMANIKAFGETTQPDIYGKAGITIDFQTGEIIYEKNIDMKTYPASTTKMLTALLLAENKQKSDILKYTEEASKQPPYSLDTSYRGIKVGEGFTASDAMDALMLFSGNDVAYLIADNVAGTGKSFADMMNEKVQKLGLKNTHFVTANGLHDPNHYTTPYDLSVIGRTAFKNPWVREAMGKKTSTIVSTPSEVKINLTNRNSLLGLDGCIGGKTGYTNPAGKCLVAFFNRGGRILVGIVMKSLYDAKDSIVFEDMKKIVDWSYKQKRVVLYPKNKVFLTDHVKYKLFGFFGPEKTIDVPLTTKEDVKYYDNEVNKKEVKTDIGSKEINPWNLSSGKAIGTVTVSQREYKKAYDLYTKVSTTDILTANILIYIGTFLGVVLVLALIIFIIVTIVAKSRKRMKF